MQVLADKQTSYVVLGAGGFIGGAMVERLACVGARVTALIHRSPGAAFIARFGVPIRTVDVCDMKELLKALCDCEVLFHCVMGDQRTITSGLENTLQAAARLRIRRIVYLSTAVVHSYAGSHPLTITEPLSPPSWSGYARAKAKAERQIRQWRSRALDCVVLRPFIVYGPRSMQWSVKPARSILSGTAYMVEGGHGRCNLVYIEHLLDAMLLAAHHPQADSRTYLIDDEFGLTWSDYYHALCDSLGVPRCTVRSIGRDQLRYPEYERTGSLDWLKEFPEVVQGVVQSQCLRGWLRRTPGLKLARQVFQRRAQPAWAIENNREIPVEIERSLAELHCYPRKVDASVARVHLGWAPRFTFEETMQRVLEWYRFIELKRSE